MQLERGEQTNKLRLGNKLENDYFQDRREDSRITSYWILGKYTVDKVKLA
jgi:hypothetical protein